MKGNAEQKEILDKRQTDRMQQSTADLEFKPRKDKMAYCVSNYPLLMTRASLLPSFLSSPYLPRILSFSFVYFVLKGS
jgi:hypothetical protein